jgi:hypothetical protein
MQREASSILGNYAIMRLPDRRQVARAPFEKV